MTTEEPDSSANAIESNFSEQQLKLLVAFIVVLQYLAKKRDNFDIPKAKRDKYLLGARMIADHFAKNPDGHFGSDSFYYGFIVDDTNCGKDFLTLLTKNHQLPTIWSILNAIIMADPSQPIERKSVIQEGEGLFGHEKGQLCYGMKVAMANFA